MNVGEVMVIVSATKIGKPRVTTQHLAEDTAKVHAALAEAGVDDYAKEPSDWPSKRRDKYVDALKKRGLAVYLAGRKSET